MARSPSPRRRFPSPVPNQATITARLKVLARHAKASRIPFDNDGSEHHKAFSRAISNVLSTELALFTFAQIIDGLPTADVSWDRRYSHLVGIHPIEQHEDICPGVLDRARRFREDFDPCILSFDPKVRRPISAGGQPTLFTRHDWTGTSLLSESQPRLPLIQHTADRARCCIDARDWHIALPARASSTRRQC
jgi:hypothetical protein